MGPVLTHTALKCLCTVFLLLSSLPLFPPAPINDPFVRVFLPRWAGRPQQDQNPKTTGLSWNFFSHVLCNLRPPTYFFFLILLFIPAFIFPLDSLYSSHLLLVLAPLLAWWIFEIPSLPSVHYMHYCSTIFFFFCWRRPLSFCLPTHTVFQHSPLRADTFGKRIFSWDVVVLQQQCEKETQTRRDGT